MKPLKNKWQQKWIGLEVTHPKLQSLADSAESFCDRWFNNDSKKSLLVIIGDYGSGKTHVAKSIYRFCSSAAMASYSGQHWPAGKFPESVFISWPEAAADFNDKKFSVVDDAMKKELVVLDDIGAENDPWKVCADRLCQILSRRERMFTVVTTNVQPAKWAEVFDGRIADRLLRNSIVMDITGVPSYAMI